MITYEDICKVSCVLTNKEPNLTNMANAYEKLKEILDDMVSGKDREKDLFREFGIDVK